MVRRLTGRGRVRTVEDRPELASALLYNFDHDWSELKLEHRSWLQEHAVALLERSGGGSVSLRGLASRIGNTSYNENLSEERARHVWNYIRQSVSIRHYIRVMIQAVGETEAANRGIPDEAETPEGFYRSVFIMVRPLSYPEVDSLTAARVLPPQQNTRIGELQIEMEQLQEDIRRLDRVRYQTQQTAVDYGSRCWSRDPNYQLSADLERGASSPWIQGGPNPGDMARDNYQRTQTMRMLEEEADNLTSQIEQKRRRIEIIGREIYRIRTEDLR